MEIRNATIHSTMLGTSHGMYVAYLDLNYGGAHQGFGGNILDDITPDDKYKRVGTAFGMEYIIQILETLEVDEWEKLPGTPCRAKVGPVKVYAIGHYLKDKWFEPEELRKKFYG